MIELNSCFNSSLLLVGSHDHSIQLTDLGLKHLLMQVDYVTTQRSLIFPCRWLVMSNIDYVHVLLEDPNGRAVIWGKSAGTGFES